MIAVNFVLIISPIQHFALNSSLLCLIKLSVEQANVPCEK